MSSKSTIEGRMPQESGRHRRHSIQGPQTRLRRGSRNSAAFTSSADRLPSVRTTKSTSETSITGTRMEARMDHGTSGKISLSALATPSTSG